METMNPSQTPRTDALNWTTARRDSLQTAENLHTARETCVKLELETIQLQARVKELEERNDLWEQGKTLPIPELIQERDSLKQQIGELKHQRSEWKSDNQNLRNQLSLANAAIVEMRKSFAKCVQSFRYHMASDFGHAKDCDCTRCEDMTRAESALSNPLIQQAK